MSGDTKRQKIECTSDDDLLYMTQREKDMATVFSASDVAFIFGEGEKLHTKRDLLMNVSPVFKAMFSSEFKELTMMEIPLPGKKMSTFMHFLWLLQPWHENQIDEKVAHEVLPLVREYQTDRLRNRLDKFFSKLTTKMDDIPPTKLISNIKEAEEFFLEQYLVACIEKASKKKYSNLVLESDFKEISRDTQARISLRRWEVMDDFILSTVSGLKQTEWYSSENCGIDGHNFFSKCTCTQKNLLRDLKGHINKNIMK